MTSWACIRRRDLPMRRGKPWHRSATGALSHCRDEH
jgi:hypothetical protein